MLRQRIITAVVLLIVLAAAVAAPNRIAIEIRVNGDLAVAVAAPRPVWMLALLALTAACACWEWLRLTLSAKVPAIVPRIVAIIICCFLLTLAWVWSSPGPTRDEVLIFGGLAIVVSLIWLTFATVTVILGRSDAPPASIGWSIFAVLATITAWGVVAEMYLAIGPLYVLTLLALVWAADICAYFGGRQFGRHKLAPRVSPGKTVEGAACGLAGAIIVTLIGAFWPDTFGYELVKNWSIPGAILVAAILGAVSILGDLFESLLKRRAGVKDSSGLLPGHGGVFDRVDAILPVIPVALLISGAMFSQ